MAKKSRRARQVQAVAQPVRIAQPRPTAASAPAPKIDFATEYHYVLEDLKRIAITAAGLLVLLIALALILS